jgi:pimeloyl-ACP methyl ester carboxylesterase
MPPSNTMRSAEFSGLSPHGFHRVCYTEWGDPQNENVLICVHGLTRNGRDFDALAQAMSDKYRVLCPDIVGRGKSGWLEHKADYGYPQYCADMASLIARSGARQVDWVGTSMGGIIGMLIASQPRNPIRRMVVNDVGPLIPKSALERLKKYVGTAPPFDTFDSAEEYLRFVSAPFGPLTDAQWRHLAVNSFRQVNGKWSVVYDPAIAQGFAGNPADVILWPYWDQIRCPVLAIRGKESDLLLSETAQEMTRRGPRTKLVEFDGIGHAPMLMQERQIAVVRSFLLSNDSA